MCGDLNRGGALLQLLLLLHRLYTSGIDMIKETFPKRKRSGSLSLSTIRELLSTAFDSLTFSISICIPSHRT